MPGFAGDRISGIYRMHALELAPVRVTPGFARIDCDATVAWACTRTNGQPRLGANDCITVHAGRPSRRMERDVGSAIIGIDKPATVYVSLCPSGLQSFCWAIIVIAGGNVRMDRMAAMEAFVRVVDAGSNAEPRSCRKHRRIHHRTGSPTVR